MLTPSWSTQQLAEFLEVFEETEPDGLLRVALNRIGESFDAEVVALVVHGKLRRSVGFPAALAPVEQLVTGARQQRGLLELDGLGATHTASTPLWGADDGYLLVGRLAEPFDRVEGTLLRSMGRALGLALTLAETRATERRLRIATEEHSQRNFRLASQLAERQRFASRLFRIQQSISHRMPLQEVLDAVTRGAAELLSVEIVGLRVVAVEPVGLRCASLVGRPDDLGPDFADQPLGEGFSGMAFTRNRLVIGEGPGSARSALAAPVHQEGRVVGVLTVASRDAERSFSSVEHETLLALAEHASLAVTDAAAVHHLRESLEGATFRARHDALTGLANRVQVLEALHRALQGAGTERPVFVVFIDLDRFKAVNDVYGHGVGDRVLTEVARRLLGAVRHEDLVGRMSGDEFVVISSPPGAVSAVDLAERIGACIGQPLLVGGRELRVTASVGVAQATTYMDADTLITDADVAMYRAKQTGRARVVGFDHNMRIEMLVRSDLERELEIAIRHQQLEVHYQPAVALATGEVVGFEALVRWAHPTRGLLAPAEFVEVAEETGQIGDIDRLVLTESCHRMARWRQSTAAAAHLYVSVNLSARRFADPHLVELVATVLADSGLSPQGLWLEITESTAMEDIHATIPILDRLRSDGVRTVIDDFGTGYSSLAYLKRFRVDALKVDRGFTAGVGVIRDDEAIVTAVARLAEALGLGLIAEGVENERQCRWLLGLGCGFGQGYLFAPPLDPAAAERLVVTGARLGPKGQSGRPVNGLVSAAQGGAPDHRG